MSRIDQLISGFLDGRLDPVDAKELADFLDQDSVLRDDFVELYRQHRLLSEQYATTSKSNFVQRVLADLRVENGNLVSGVISEPRQENQQVNSNERASQIKRSFRDRTTGGLNFWLRLFRPSPVGWLATAAVGVLLVVGCFFVFRNSPLSAVVTKASVGVTVVRSDKNLSCYEGFQLRTGDMLRTPTNGTAVIQYLGEQTTLDLRAGTRLRFQNSKHGKRLNLEAGEISVIAGHQPANAPMVLVTPQAEARVVGTRFLLAARRFSTWLEVSEGGVAFKSNSNGSNGQGVANSKSDFKPVIVKSGEYAVVAGGIPLETYQVTDQLNLAHPLPIKIDWFSYYGQPNWYIHPPYVQQTQPASTSRTFQLPATKGSILVAGGVTVNSVKRDLTLANGDVGFAVGLSAGSDYLMACVQRKNGQPVLEIVDLNMVPLAEIPVSVSSWPVCKVKFALERGAAQEAMVRAKVWSETGEPEAWQLSTTIKLQGLSDVFELRLMTMNSACTFENVSAFLIE
ncbi:MAG: anti-FecI sigma factor, FecR [Pedosphaera sp.]|nr:anti-FecI sigma factor, FecR [Pedosphaera sp.]